MHPPFLSDPIAIMTLLALRSSCGVGGNTSPSSEAASVHVAHAATASTWLNKIGGGPVPVTDSAEKFAVGSILRLGGAVVIGCGGGAGRARGC